MSTVDVIRQMIEQALFNSNITSAGGDSPKINRVFAVDVNPIEFEEMFRAAIREELEGMREREAGVPKVPEEIEGEGKLTEGQVTGLARKGLSAAQNPASIVATGLAFLPHAVLVSFVIGMMPLIFAELTRAGSTFDLRWKRILADEFNAFLDRQAQHNTRIGTRQVIIQSSAGFINLNGGESNTNTVRLARKGWTGIEDVSELDYVNHKKGLF